jgi:hypothetical protein
MKDFVRTQGSTEDQGNDFRIQGGIRIRTERSPGTGSQPEDGARSFKPRSGNGGVSHPESH